MFSLTECFLEILNIFTLAKCPITENLSRCCRQISLTQTGNSDCTVSESPEFFLTKSESSSYLLKELQTFSCRFHSIKGLKPGQVLACNQVLIPFCFIEVSVPLMYLCVIFLDSKINNQHPRLLNSSLKPVGRVSWAATP